MRQVFNRWQALARACGPVTVYAQKTRIVFQTRVRFAGAIVHNEWLDASLWLGRRVQHPCLHRTESFGRLGFGVRFRLTKVEDVDRKLEALMLEAYVKSNDVRTDDRRVPHARVQPVAAGVRTSRRG